MLVLCSIFWGVRGWVGTGGWGWLEVRGGAGGCNV